ncbi:WD40/YVTN/BNR-like repeat-containing protein [Marinobacter zhejiangensis]|uniref:Photosynthesis system II assembly factor YCF48 n=1 Tax=Marinobacter zhejiangensis TaxID=488535 RepID=A0A1I4KRN9_9GAMM|nr:YCF48-related protein [Marinobacter zhejiangensis]SFL81283.1 Photosynthesis system II assembly factor YCF48 [Marinobacter zhejiangensis]
MANPFLCPRGAFTPCVAVAGLSAVLLTGCEAPLNLDAVREQSQQTVRRTDFYQSMASNSEIVALGGNAGVLLISENHGQSWQRVELPTSDSFISLDSCPDGSFVALTFSNQLWHGNATATQWTPHSLPSQEQMMAATCAPDGSWWTSGSFTTIQHSADQGASWEETSLDEDAVLTSLQFLDSNVALATGEYGLVLKTQDGGETWDHAGALPDEFYPHATYFMSEDEGWVGGLNGFIYHTVDGGESWRRQPTDTNAPIFGFVPGDNSLFALGDNATVLAMANGQWQRLSTPNLPLYLRDGLVLDNRQLLVAGGRGLLLNLNLPDATVASNH